MGLRGRWALTGLVCAMALMGQRPDRAAQIEKLRALADQRTAQGLQQALAGYTTIVADARAAADRPSEADALYLSGVATLRLGRFPEAVGFYDKSVTLYRELGDRPHLATAL